MKKYVSVLAAGILSVVSNQAMSDLIKVEFSGTIFSSSYNYFLYGASFPHSISLGSGMTQSYIYDDQGEGSLDASTGGYIYPGSELISSAIQSASSVINGHTFATESLYQFGTPLQSPGTEISIQAGALSDQVHMGYNGISNLYGLPASPDEVLVGMSIDLLDSTGSALSSNLLPDINLNHADYTTAIMQLNVEQILSYGPLGNAITADAFQATAFITDVKVTNLSAVPLPAAVWLFVAGLAGLLGVARRK